MSSGKGKEKKEKDRRNRSNQLSAGGMESRVRSIRKKSKYIEIQNVQNQVMMSKERRSQQF